MRRRRCQHSGPGQPHSNTADFSVLDGAAFSTAANLSNTGTVTIGTASTLTVNGNYTQGTAATLDVELGGTPAAASSANWSQQWCHAERHTSGRRGGNLSSFRRRPVHGAGLSFRSGTFTTLKLPSSPAFSFQATSMRVTSYCPRRVDDRSGHDQHRFDHADEHWPGKTYRSDTQSPISGRPRRLPPGQTRCSCPTTTTSRTSAADCSASVRRTPGASAPAPATTQR